MTVITNIISIRIWSSLLSI